MYLLKFFFNVLFKIMNRPKYIIKKLLCLFAFGVLIAPANAEDLSIFLSETQHSYASAALLNIELSTLIKGNTITISLPDRQLLELQVTKLKTNQGITSLHASGNDGELLVLNYDNKASYGSLNGNGLRYNITSDKNSPNVSSDGSSLIFTNINHTDFPEIDLSEDALVPPTMDASKPIMEQLDSSQRAAIGLDDELATSAQNISTSTIRMLILYSQEFGNGFSSPLARINQLIDFTNTSFQNSNIPITLELAEARQVNFNNNLSTNNTLDLVTNAQGSFSNVEQLRDQFAADMVAVLSFQPGFSSNGVAWINGSNPNFAFSSTRLSPGCCDSVFAHEIGHNLGSGHERNSVNPSNSACDFNFTGYSCGHGNRNNTQGSWGTVMSRLNSNLVNHVFSNPSLSCLGEACGVPQGSSNSADNFASFNMSRLLVAQFRPDPAGTPDLPDSPNPGTPSPSSVAPLMLLLLDEED